MASTFSNYYVARSGIQNAQYNLSITGQNISNVNTDGYTRQRVSSSALPSFGNNMRYASKSDLAIGQGVESTGVTQLRNPYLDIRYRAEHAKTGLTETELDALNSVQNIFDETNTNGINAQMTDLVKQLRTLAATPSDTNLENIVKNSSQLLVNAFHNAASQLQNVRDQQAKSFQTDAVDKVNTLLKDIAHLNQEIHSSEISQTPALELRDQRNSLLDELSQYVNIQIDHTDVPVGAGRTVEELTVKLVSSSGGSTVNLVENDKANQFDLKFKTASDPSTDPSVTIRLKNASGTEITDGNGDPVLTNKDVAAGTFGGYLSILNDNGEYDGTTTARGIGYYEKTLDLLTNKFAGMMNSVNSTNAAQDNKPLFATSDKSTTITAANISISSQWNSAVGSYLTATKDETLPGVNNSAAGKNILYMINQFSKEQTFQISGGTTIFSTSFDSFMSKVSTTLGLQINTISSQNDTFNSTLNEINTQRAALSSVDVNEEGINLIMYNQALTASSRFMTTVDEAVDTIINKMGVVGR